MDQTALRYFLEVARSGSLSKASERLFVAVSALSRQIAKIEEQMGTPLFERRPRGMVLTEAAACSPTTRAAVNWKTSA